MNAFHEKMGAESVHESRGTIKLLSFHSLIFFFSSAPYETLLFVVVFEKRGQVEECEECEKLRRSQHPIFKSVISSFEDKFSSKRKLLMVQRWKF